MPGVFQWYRNTVILTGEDRSVISPLETGTYLITYSYGNCAVSASTNVTKAPTLTHQNIVACENSSEPITINSNVTGVNYAWSTGANGMDLKTINITVQIDTNYYAATVTDAVGCSSADSVRVIGIPVPAINMNDTTACAGTMIILNARPANIPNIDSFNPTYKWFRNPTLLTSTNDSLFVNVVGTYIVNLTIGVCTAADTSVVTFNPVPVSALPDSTKFCKETENFIVLDAGAGVGYTYLWTPSAGTPIDSNTTQTIGVRFEGTYAVTITNTFNCPTTDSVFVMDVCPPRVFVPDAFVPGTPGPDGGFKVFGAYFINYQMLVFNRWGEVIFMSTDRNESWDGTYMGEPMPVGVYPWVVTYEGEDPDLRGPYRLDGSVTIIR
ncbi:MAG: gliding motility-associated C-terminal domain-containing protein [Cytophagaceae bacterium]|nr:gliding motility-associated C-terminal domain-containing protein [Cytophagaceae bacterium]